MSAVLPVGGTAPPTLRATVVSGTTATEYLRAGHGPAVLYLPMRGETASRDRVLAALAPRFRVIAPEWPTGLDAGAPAAVAGWLRGLLDGLGIERATVLADAVLGPAVLGFALGEPFRVRRVALLAGDDLAAACRGLSVAVFGAAASRDAASHGSGGGADACASAVADFLEDAADAGPAGGLMDD